MVFKGSAMTIPYHIIVGSEAKRGQRERAEEVIQKVFEEIDQIYNNWNPRSEISHLNRLKAGEKAVLSPGLHLFLKEIDRIVALTDGKFDPTIEPAQKLWKEKLAQGEVPSEEELNKIKCVVGWSNIRIKDNLFWKLHDATALDLGGIAKGLCIDKLLESLQEAGFPDIFVEWGGEIRTAGQHPEKRPWKIYISRLGDRDPNKAITTLSLENQAIATSGDYLQNWTVYNRDMDGGMKPRTFSHIVNPKDCKLIEISRQTIASASVMASNCALADGVATAAMMFDNLEDAKQWSLLITKNNPDISFWLFTREALSESPVQEKKINSPPALTQSSY